MLQSKATHDNHTEVYNATIHPRRMLVMWLYGLPKDTSQDTYDYVHLFHSWSDHLWLISIPGLNRENAVTSITDQKKRVKQSRKSYLNYQHYHLTATVY